MGHPHHHRRARERRPPTRYGGDLAAARAIGGEIYFLLTGSRASKFVFSDMLEGGVNAGLGLDGHGKSLSFLLLAATRRLDAALLARLVDPTSVGPAAE